MQTYTFELVIDDTGDEFSEQFNPNNEEDVIAFEDSIKEVIEADHWDVKHIRLKRVTTTLEYKGSE